MDEKNPLVSKGVMIAGIEEPVMGEMRL